MERRIQFNASPRELELMSMIADRAVHLAQDMGYTYRKEDIMLDLNACVSNAWKLDLQGLLDSDLGDFGHDVFGINKHMDRQTGLLKDCFVPRYALGKAGE